MIDGFNFYNFIVYVCIDPYSEPQDPRKPLGFVTAEETVRIPISPSAVFLFLSIKPSSRNCSFKIVH